MMLTAILIDKVFCQMQGNSLRVCPSCSVLHVGLALALIAPPGLARESASKAEVPDENAQAEKVALARDIYKQDYDQAQTREQKIRFSRKLYRVGLDTKNDLVGRFVLLRIARDISTEQGDLETSLGAIDAMDESFEIDVLKMKATALVNIAEAVRMRSGNQALVREFLDMLDLCIQSDRYAIAEPLASIAVTISLKARDNSLRSAAIAKRDELVELASRFKKIADSLDVLANNNNDPEANLAVGKFYCFVKGDWATGLPMLAASADDTLKSLSMQELSKAQNELALGDGWWEFSETTEDLEKNRIRRHAAMMYARAIPDLSGLNKARVERRIQETGLMDNDSAIAEQPATRFALALDGESSYVTVNSYRYNGRYPITVEAIVKVDEPPKTNGVICGTYDDAGIGLAILKNGLWEFTLRSRSGGYRHSQSGKAATLGQWTHLAGVYDMSHCYLCVDGKIQPSVHPVPGGHKASNIPVHLGMNPGRVAVDFFHGQIQELRISKVARYNAHFRAPQHFDVDENTILLLKFDEGSGVVATDASSNKHHGSIVNGTWIPLK